MLSSLRDSELNPLPIASPYTPANSPPSLTPPEPAPFHTLYSAAPVHTRDSTQYLRFLRARNFDFSASLELFKKFLAWRAAFRVSDVDAIRAHVTREIESGKAYWCGRDRDGRLALVVRPARHKPAEVKHIEDTLRFAVYLMEEGMNKLRAAADSSASSSQPDQIVLIYDRSDMSRTNFDSRLMSLMRELSSITQDFYAERMFKSYIFPINWLYWIVYKMMSPFIAQKTKDKFVLLGKKEELKQFFDDSGLSERYGGSVVDPVFRAEQGLPAADRPLGLEAEEESESEAVEIAKAIEQ